MAKNKIPSGTGSLVVVSLIFLLVGVKLVIKPIHFSIIGGSSRYSSVNRNAFSADDAQGFGVVFILLGLLVGYGAYRYYKS